MKKILALLLCLAMVFSLCACGEDEVTETKPEGETTAPAEEVIDQGADQLTATVTFGHNLTDAQVESINHRLQPFYARFPGVQVVFKYMEGPITAENAPTVLLCSPEEVPAYQEAGLLMDLNNWINANGWVVYNGSTEMHAYGLTADQKDDIEPLFYEEGKQFGDDATYLLPFMGSILTMYYNATMFEENALIISPSLSWEELLENCQTLKKLDPDCVPLAINEVDETFLSLCAQMGFDFTADSWQNVFGDEGMAIAKELNSMYQKGYLTTAGLEGTRLDLDDNADRARNYIVIDSSANSAEQIPTLVNEAYEYEVNAMTVSRMEGEFPKVYTGSQGLAICTNDDDDVLNAAWMLVKFMCVETSLQGGMAKDTGTIPTVRSAWLDEEFGQYLNESNGGSGLAGVVALLAQDQESYRFTASSFAGSAEIRAQLTTLIEQCLTFTGDVETQIAEAFANTLESLDK